MTIHTMLFNFKTTEKVPGKNRNNANKNNNK